jgi:hypothetical protein
MRKEERSWLEPALQKELRRVKAPAELWRNIEKPRVASGNTGRFIWALGGAMVVAALLWGFHLRGEESRLPSQSWMPAQMDSKSCVLCHVGA